MRSLPRSVEIESQNSRLPGSLNSRRAFVPLIYLILEISADPSTRLFAGGIGAGLAEAFSETGYHVFATARTTSKIPKSLSQASNVTVLKLDVLSSDDIAAAVASVKAANGGTLDVLVNNSGALMVMPMLDLSIEEGKKLFDTNFWSLVR